jgi:hypothetical protein
MTLMNGPATTRVPTIGEIVRGAAVAVLAAALWCAPSWAQDQAPPDPGDEQAKQQEPESDPADSSAEGAEPGAAGSESGDAGAAADDTDLDEQSYDPDDDDFVPSEEIPADEPIPFPSDI